MSSSGMWGRAQRGRATGGLRGACSEYLGRVSAGCGISESGSSPRRGVSASGLSPSGGSLRTCVLVGGNKARRRALSRLRLLSLAVGNSGAAGR